MPWDQSFLRESSSNLIRPGIPILQFGAENPETIQTRSSLEIRSSCNLSPIWFSQASYISAWYKWTHSIRKYVWIVIHHAIGESGILRQVRGYEKRKEKMFVHLWERVTWLDINWNFHINGLEEWEIDCDFIPRYKRTDRWLSSPNHQHPANLSHKQLFRFMNTVHWFALFCFSPFQAFF